MTTNIHPKEIREKPTVGSVQMGHVQAVAFMLSLTYQRLESGASWSCRNDGPANMAVDHLSWAGDTLIAATHGGGCFAIAPITCLQFGLITPGTSNYYGPCNMLARGTNAVFRREMIVVKRSKSNPETMRIAKPMTMGALGGPVPIDP